MPVLPSLQVCCVAAAEGNSSSLAELKALKDRTEALGMYNFFKMFSQEHPAVQMHEVQLSRARC